MQICSIEFLVSKLNLKIFSWGLKKHAIFIFFLSQNLSEWSLCQHRDLKMTPRSLIFCPIVFSNYPNTYLQNIQKFWRSLRIQISFMSRDDDDSILFGVLMRSVWTRFQTVNKKHTCFCWTRKLIENKSLIIFHTPPP